MRDGPVVMRILAGIMNDPRRDVFVSGFVAELIGTMAVAVVLGRTLWWHTAMVLSALGGCAVALASVGMVFREDVQEWVVSVCTAAVMIAITAAASGGLTAFDIGAILFWFVCFELVLAIAVAGR